MTKSFRTAFCALAALFASGAVAPQPDVQALGQVFSHARIIGARTFAAGVRRLLPGHWLAWSDGRAEIRPYWDASFPSRHDYDRRAMAVTDSTGTATVSRTQLIIISSLVPECS